MIFMSEAGKFLVLCVMCKFLFLLVFFRVFKPEWGIVLKILLGILPCGSVFPMFFLCLSAYFCHTRMDSDSTPSPTIVSCLHAGICPLARLLVYARMNIHSLGNIWRVELILFLVINFLWPSEVSDILWQFKKRELLIYLMYF